MTEGKEPIYGEEKILPCPECRRDTKHRWIGYYMNYSQWECVSCGKVILGTPYKPLES